MTWHHRGQAITTFYNESGDRSAFMMPRTCCGIKGGASFTNCVITEPNRDRTWKKEGLTRVLLEKPALGVAYTVQHQRQLSTEDEVAQSPRRQPPDLATADGEVDVQPVRSPLGQHLVSKHTRVPPRHLSNKKNETK